MAEHDPSAPALFEISALAPAPSTTRATSSFMDLEDPRYAYMFGFLQADGHLASGTGRKGRLTVEIGVRDIAILREFQQLTPYNSSITERVRSTNFAEQHHSATWTLCDLEARTRINGLGLPYGRKSKRITPPRVEFSRRDYLRGIIDADGSVGHTGQGLPFVSLTTASAAVGAYLCRYAKVVTGAARQIGRNARDGVYNVVYTKEAAVQLAEHLYYPGCLSLARKRTAATSLASWERPATMRVRPPGRRWRPWEDRVLLALDDDTASAAELGRSKASCSVRLWRLKTGQVPRPEDVPPGM
ncbi:LAGLIDADG family homing endonuclease [Streptomyces microflavus]|uniref:LAGLIDADG family homing endonuclease n=1 Tax=Streptomyces TaxID=1883 RepID=UPI001914AFE6|nr:LAGLIDADG family homing endonuclease [Streptomyces sp. MBT58]MBK5990849.1 LAGLIDADG family homing endonuclease [Streptomyces sp. MBT58]